MIRASNEGVMCVLITKGVSPPNELARRPCVSKQVVSRYEETNYQTVAIARLLKILDAAGLTTAVTLTE